MDDRPYFDSPYVDVWDLAQKGDKKAVAELEMREEERRAEERRQAEAARQRKQKEEDDYYDLPGEGGRKRRSRLNVKRRRTQRNRGGRKHRKLRKLSTRRR